MPLPTVILADDHAIVVDGLRRILERSFEVVHTVKDGRALVAAAGKFKPDIIVTDISMPLLNGIEAVRQIKKAHPRVKVVILTMHYDVAYALEAFQAGASGYVLKHSASSELVTALQEVLRGRVYITPRIAREVMEALADGSNRKGGSDATITARQREVLQLLAEGYTMHEIAGILHVSERTVQYHKYGMMQRLGIRTNAELIQYAVRHRIVEQERCGNRSESQ